MVYIYRKIVAAAVGTILTAITALSGAVFSTADPSSAKYPVFGVDVSNYQGEIDWQRLEEQGVKFAFIKATEGSGFVDSSVGRNLSGISDTEIARSCYHFFSFDSPGETQAANFIAAVSRADINMPPVIDIEWYGDKAQNKPSGNEVDGILMPLLEELERHYGVKPIIYTTLPVYYRYISGKYGDYPLWIRCTQMSPDLVDWQFWQYSDKGLLDGYNGDEQYIDLNVFSGSFEEFSKLCGK